MLIRIFGKVVFQSTKQTLVEDCCSNPSLGYKKTNRSFTVTCVNCDKDIVNVLRTN